MYRFKNNLLTIGVLGVTTNVVANAEEFEENDNKRFSEVEVVEVIGSKIAGARNVQITDIQRKQAADLEDLFRDQPNITVGGGFGAAQKIYVRGIEDTNLNVTVDGASQSGQLFHHQGRLSIEPDLLKQVEIKAGAGTALDGFGALGGAIHFETKDVEDLLEIEDNFGALVKTGYLSNTEGTHLSTSLFGNLTDSISAIAYLGKREGDKFEDGNGELIKNTDYEQEAGLIKLEFNANEHNKFKVSHEKRIDDGRRNLRVHFNNAPWNQTTEQESERTTSKFSYIHDDVSDLLDFTLSLFKTENKFSFAEIETDYFDSMSIETDGADLRNISAFGEHKVTYGIQYQKNKTKHEAADASETDDAYAIYVQDNFTFGDSTSVSYGLRFDDYSYDDAFGKKFSADGFSPNANIEHQLTSRWLIRAGYSQAIRGQSTKQAIMVGNVGNASDLTEEKAYNTEISASYQHDGFYLNTTIFSTEIKDIVAAEGNPFDGFFYQNIGTLRSKGLDLTLAKNWEYARVAMNFSRNKPKVNGMPLNDSHFGIGTSYGDTLSFNASYQFSKYDAELGWSSRFVQEMDDVPVGYPAKKSFNVHDLFIEWYPQAIKNTSINLTVHNIFDKYYFDHGTFGFDPDSQTQIGLPEPGRDIRFTIGWNF